MSDTKDTDFMFVCKTDNAYQMKTIAEIITHVIKTSFWEISKHGIKLCMFDKARVTMISIDLLSENFQRYMFTGDEPIYIGMNSIHFHKMLKSIKKKDSLELKISSSNLNELEIHTIPRDKIRITKSSIKIQVSQNIDVGVPDGYPRSIIIPSSDFQKMIKDLILVNSDKIKIETSDGYINFSSNADGIMKRSIQFGERSSNSSMLASNYFSTDTISKISKISALSTCIHVFPCSDERPIQLKTNVGTLGTIKLFIKSDEIIETENC